MSWRLAAAGRRCAVTAIALGCAVCYLGTFAFAQNARRPEDEIFGGYAALIPNGWGDLDYKINNIPNAFGASNTFYFPGAPNFGILIDGSGHFGGGTTPPNLANGSNNSTGVGYALGGFQYKYHTSSLSPFFRGFVGAANISPDCCHGTEWSVAAGGGGGLDLSVKPRFSIRLAQVDYIYSTYSHIFPSVHPTQWNSVRLAAGVVFNLGSFSNLPLSCSVTVAPTPTEVWAGEPVRLSVTGTNFNAKHPTNYGWTTNGGKLSSSATQASEIDTTGLVPGSYSVTATLTDPKIKKMNSATCSGAFIVKQPHPPVVSCSVSPSTITVGESATATLTASSPDQRPLTYSWSANGGTLSSNGASTTLTASDADLGNTITITGTASDGVTPPQSSSCTVTAKHPGAVVEKCIIIANWGECTFEKDRKRPWRVDNDCKDTLDKLALRLQQIQSGKLDIVGYTDKKELVRDPTLGAQRSVNIKYYLTTDGPNKIDAARIQPRQGGTEEGKAAEFYYVADGKLCSGQVEAGSVVDETKLKGRSRTGPAPKKQGTAKAKPEAPASQ